MGELEITNRIISQAVRDSSYFTVILSSCIFLIYTLIVKGIDYYKSKDRNKPFIQMATAIKEIGQNVVKLNQVLDKIFQDAETKEIEKINHVIVVAFNSLKASILAVCIDIIIHNNIEANKDQVHGNLYKVISTSYYKVYSIFSAYEFDGVNVASKIKEEWIDKILEECLQIIYSNNEPVTRIRQLNNRLTLLSEEYSIFVTNKVFNH